LNAADAIELSPISLAERWIQLQISTSESSIHFQIQDSGPGVSSEIEKKIMEPFFTTKPVGKGTGLGLSVSNAIAKEHGGFLTLDRTVSASCFAFEIAIDPKSKKSLSKAA
jgi:C4-dicarboxylate-specific signal transduction histidine kinase